MKKERRITFIAINVLILISLLLPKEINSIFGIIPINLLIISITALITIIELLQKKLSFNKQPYIPLIIIYSLFLLATIPSLFVSRNLIVSIYTIIKFTSYFIIFLLLYKIDFKKEEYQTFYKISIIAITILVIYGLISYIFSIDLLSSGIEKYIGSKGRISATFGNPINYGVLLNLIFGFIFFKSINTKFNENKNKWVFYTLLSLLIFINILLTFTRSVLIILIFTIGGLVLFLRNLKLFKKAITTLLVFILIALPIPGISNLSLVTINDSVKMVFKIDILDSYIKTADKNEKQECLLEEKYQFYCDYSLTHRIEYSKIAKRIAKDNFLTGVGFGTYMDYMESNDFDLKYPDYDYPKGHPHNSFLLLFVETGIFSIIFFLTFIIYIGYYTLKYLIVNLKNDKYYINLIALISYIGFVIVSTTINALQDIRTFSITIMLFAIILNRLYNTNNINNKTK